jgi:hypothetical protein
MARKGPEQNFSSRSVNFQFTGSHSLRFLKTGEGKFAVAFPCFFLFKCWFVNNLIRKFFKEACLGEFQEGEKDND